MNDEMMEALDETKTICKLIEEKGYKNNVQVDMSMVTELDYYDGLIFKGYLPQSYKSIISGEDMTPLQEYLERRFQL